MGSLFINSHQWGQYDYNTPPKKEPFTSGSSNSLSDMFEDNLCVEMKKRELGIFENDYFYNADGGRNSPQTDRLVREILAQEITDVAANLAISIDPRQWSIEDSCAWLRHYANYYQIPGNITEFLTADGNTLCSYTDQDFIVRIGCPRSGSEIAAQLAMWKNVGRSVNGAPVNFHKQQYVNSKLELAEQCRSQPAKLGLDINCGWGPAPPPQVFSPPPPPPGLISPNQYVNNTNNMEPNNMRPPTFQELPRSSYQPFTQNNQQIPAYFVNEGRYLPKPTIPLERFRSVREACQDTGFLSVENYQKFSNMTPPPSMMAMFSNMSGGSSSKVNLQIPTSNTSGFNEEFENPSERQPPQMTRDDPEPEMKTPVMRDLDDEDIEPSYIDLNLDTIKQEVDQEPHEHEQVKEPPIENPPTEKPPKKKSTKHPIHLWEFLKQLLQDGKDCIRWIDEDKGVFKIYNSQQVAKFWGERKNRPAMNYDKLSRSIRQYYKKGIIKKTTQGKRLVYQFCEAYL